jgi:hypothetical protein
MSPFWIYILAILAYLSMCLSQLSYYFCRLYLGSKGNFVFRLVMFLLCSSSSLELLYHWCMVHQHHTKHKQSTNTDTMVVELLAPPATWFWWLHTVQRMGHLSEGLAEASIEGIQLVHKIKRDSKLFLSNSLLITKLLACRQQCWPK